MNTVPRIVETTNPIEAIATVIAYASSCEIPSPETMSV